MYEFKDVNGCLNKQDIKNNRNIEFNKDTVYIRSNIKQSDDNPELFIYDEVQLTYEEYDKYKDKYTVEVLEEEISSLKSENDLLKGCIMEMADVVFA